MILRRLGRGRQVGEEDYGLLFPIATAASAEAVRCVRATLRANGIRSTTTGYPAPGRPPRIRVLVFPEDAPRAYRVLCADTT
ncbi:hypothetical protein [Nocardia cyriacigeorgica]|uniref:hypothetical protein n=1 Tax=Nocardia cyriacigeorgica TaxID=135487 RepID=UPI0018945906|nr:hypothetical protein [Nocardia cyriacigeorgica]MBF6455266.1 hypothetical protein [Nocardia cyriacigeorgica]MBF6553992.1 hypothetical protein [Nocardia cyriacigeorgica]